MRIIKCSPLLASFLLVTLSCHQTIQTPVSEQQTVAGPDKIVPEGFMPLFNGIDLDGWEVRQSEGLESFAKELARDPSLPPLLHVDSPYALQFHMNSMDRIVSFEDAAAALTSGEPCGVAVNDVARLRKTVGDAVTLYEIGSCPASREGERVTLFSNQPR